MPTSSSKSLWALLLLLSLLLACGMPQANAPATQPPAITASSGVAEERAMGDPNAPVTLVEYGDYQ